MKARKNTDVNKLITSSFDKINSSTGQELDEIVNVIEKYGRKERNKVTKRDETTKKSSTKSRQFAAR